MRSLRKKHSGENFALRTPTTILVALCIIACNLACALCIETRSQGILLGTPSVQVFMRAGYVHVYVPEHRLAHLDSLYYFRSEGISYATCKLLDEIVAGADLAQTHWSSAGFQIAIYRD